MTKEELETREKLKLMNVAKEWLRTEHSEGNIQSLVNLISSFTEPREKHIAELKKQLDLKEKALSKAKKEIKRIADRVNKDKRRLIRRKAELEEQVRYWMSEYDKLLNGK